MSCVKRAYHVGATYVGIQCVLCASLCTPVISCNTCVHTYVYFTTYVNEQYAICTVCIRLCLAAKFVPLAYGIKKLQITCVVEDDKIGTDFLEESITAFEDLVHTCIYTYMFMCV